MRFAQAMSDTTPRALYDPTSASPAYHLRYTWTGWPSGKPFTSQPNSVLDETSSLWEQDGLRLLEHRWTEDKVQLAFSVKPNVSPLFLATRAKGRLDHAVRSSGLAMPLSRKLAVRSVGNNTRQEVERYIQVQVGAERFVDPSFAAQLHPLQYSDPAVDLCQPSASARGRYWYNLHVVLVVAERFRIADLTLLRRIRDVSLKVAAKKGYFVSRLAVMPDHLHLALRPDFQHSPNDVVFAFQNNLAFALAQQRLWLWCDNFYAGTFGEYTFDAVRHHADS